MKKVLILFGPPGSGKGTQSSMLSKKHNMLHISTGDLMRREVNSGSELGQHLKELFKKGHLASDEIALEMLEKEMLSNSNKDGFILDGFPRTVAQVPMLEQLLTKIGYSLTDVFGLEISDKEELVKRIVKRGETSNRPDDKDPDVIRERLRVYEDETAPVIDCYKTVGLYRPINGLNDVDSVSVHIEGFLL